MTLKHHFRFFLLIIIYSSCRNINCDENPIFSNYLALESKNEQIPKGNKLLLFLNYLSKSDQENINKILKTFNVTPDENSMLSIAKSINISDGMIIYRFYCDQQMLSPNLLLLYLTALREKNKDSCLEIIFNIEINYLSGINKGISKNSFQYSKSQLLSCKNQFPNSLRIKYLYAEFMMINSGYKEAIETFNQLINKDYYSYTCLRSVLKCYSKVGNIDSVAKYEKLISERFNDKCLPEALSRISDSTIFFQRCNICLVSKYASDSIEANIEMSKYFLNQNNYDQVLNKYNNYIEKNPLFNGNDLKIWERGEYYDIMLQSFFKQKKYTELTDFILKSVKNNDKIKISNRNDFIELLRGYYTKYYPVYDKEEFNIFIQRNFSKYIFPENSNKL